MATTTSNPWLQTIKAQPAAKLRLICFPFAGGSPDNFAIFPTLVHVPASVYYSNLSTTGSGLAIYRSWAPLVPASVELVAVCPPGRERRMREPNAVDIISMAKSIASALSEVATELPLVFYGHSMGGIVAYEVVKEMLQRGLRLPRLVIIGATTPPCERTGPKDGEPLIRHFDLGQMRELLREYGATPDEILNNDAHLAFFLPPVQADLAMIQEYPGTGRSSVLPVPLFYMGGEDEKLSKETQLAWGQHTQDFSSRFLRAGHFFVTTHTTELVQSIVEKLTELALI